MLPPKGLTLIPEQLVCSYLREAEVSPWDTKEGFRMHWLRDLQVKVFSEGGGLEEAFLALNL